MKLIWIWNWLKLGPRGAARAVRDLCAVRSLYDNVIAAYEKERKIADLYIKEVDRLNKALIDEVLKTNEHLHKLQQAEALRDAATVVSTTLIEAVLQHRQEVVHEDADALGSDRKLSRKERAEFQDLERIVLFDTAVPVPEGIVERCRELTKGVDIGDINQPLDPNDD